MKRLFAITLVCMCLLALCACGQDALPAVTTTEAIPTEETTTATPSTTQVPTMPPIEYPVSYKDAPEAYKPVLDQFYAFAQALRGDDWDAANAISPFAWPVGHEGLAYAVKDINNDGVKELLLVDESQYCEVVLYTLEDGKPLNVHVFGKRSYVKFAADGTLYNYGSSGADNHDFYTYKLCPGASELTQLTGYKQDNSNYYKDVGGEWQPITEEEWDALIVHPPTPMLFNFIPIEQ